ncbi:uncharacterized protein ACN427_001435 isoform 2-T2 [Glossina fuscipes fuscipes]
MNRGNAGRPQKINDMVKKAKADIEDGELSTSSSSDVNVTSHTNSEEDKQKVLVFKSVGRFQGRIFDI